MYHSIDFSNTVANKVFRTQTNNLLHCINSLCDNSPSKCFIQGTNKFSIKQDNDCVRVACYKDYVVPPHF